MNENQYYTMLEEIAVRGCVAAATAAGYTPAEAEECDDGSMACPSCPFCVGFQRSGEEGGNT